MLNDYKAPEEGNIIVPEYFSNDGLNIKWEGFRDNLDPLPEIYYRIDNAEGQQLSGRTDRYDEQQCRRCGRAFQQGHRKRSGYGADPALEPRCDPVCAQQHLRYRCR